MSYEALVDTLERGIANLGLLDGRDMLRPRSAREIASVLADLVTQSQESGSGA